MAASLRVQPAQDVDLAWDAGHRTLTIRPADAWRPDTLHSVTVDPGALALTGRPMAKPVRAAFLTRAATDGRIEATRPRGERIAIDTGFTITFSRPVTAASVVAGLRADPVMDGTLVATTWNRDGTELHVHAPPAPPREHEVHAVPVRRPDGRRRGPRSGRLRGPHGLRAEGGPRPPGRQIHGRRAHRQDLGAVQPAHGQDGDQGGVQRQGQREGDQGQGVVQRRTPRRSPSSRRRPSRTGPG